MHPHYQSPCFLYTLSRPTCPYTTRLQGTPPPVPRNRLAQEPPPGSAVEFSHNFFYQGIGFFMVLVDVGQLFKCAGQHFMCVAMGPPIRGDPISHSQAHIPLKPLPPALDPFPEATSP